MKKPIEFHPEVALDIKGSYDWYENQLEGLGKRFIHELEDGFKAIENFPQTWANFQHGFKRYILTHFPFSIVYKESKDKILIVAVMHNSRNPEYWKDRNK